MKNESEIYQWKVSSAEWAGHAITEVVSNENQWIPYCFIIVKRPNAEYYPQTQDYPTY